MCHGRRKCQKWRPGVITQREHLVVVRLFIWHPVSCMMICTWHLVLLFLYHRVTDQLSLCYQSIYLSLWVSTVHIVMLYLSPLSLWLPKQLSSHLHSNWCWTRYVTFLSESLPWWQFPATYRAEMSLCYLSFSHEDSVQPLTEQLTLDKRCHFVIGVSLMMPISSHLHCLSDTLYL